MVLVTFRSSLVLFDAERGDNNARQHRDLRAEDEVARNRGAGDFDAGAVRPAAEALGRDHNHATRGPRRCDEAVATLRVSVPADLEVRDCNDDARQWRRVRGYNTAGDGCLLRGHGCGHCCQHSDQREQPSGE
jgi:hypothetical protein